jgi:hypothetical protein
MLSGGGAERTPLASRERSGAWSGSSIGERAKPLLNRLENECYDKMKPVGSHTDFPSLSPVKSGSGIPQRRLDLREFIRTVRKKGQIDLVPKALCQQRHKSFPLRGHMDFCQRQLKRGTCFQGGVRFETKVRKRR